MLQENKDERSAVKTWAHDGILSSGIIFLETQSAIKSHTKQQHSHNMRLTPFLRRPRIVSVVFTASCRMKRIQL